MLDAYFKYYTADALKLALVSATRKWSSPFEFNDPFDNRLDIQWTGSSIDIENSMAARIIRLVEEENTNLDLLSPEILFLVYTIRAMPSADRSAFLEILKEPEEIYTQAGLSDLHVKINEALELLLSDTSIFCLTEDHDNLLMWAHYADNHKGGVIKFLPVEQVDSPLLLAKKVVYSASSPAMEFTNLLDNTAEFRRAIIDTITLTKSIDWQYEKEWRVVTALRNHVKKYEILPFAEEEVGGLYLGCRIPEKNKSELIEIIAEKYPWAPIYQAIPKKSEFSLTFEQLSGPT